MYVNAIKLVKKIVMNSKDSIKHMEGLEGRKRKGECNYNLNKNI